MDGSGYHVQIDESLLFRGCRKYNSGRFKAGGIKISEIERDKLKNLPSLQLQKIEIYPLRLKRFNTIKGIYNTKKNIINFFNIKHIIPTMLFQNISRKAW